MTSFDPTEDILREKWMTIRAEILKVWPRLSEADLAHADGDFTKLEILVQQKCRISREETHAKLEELTENFRRGLKEDLSSGPSLASREREGVRGSLRDQYRQF